MQLANRNLVCLFHDLRVDLKNENKIKNNYLKLKSVRKNL